LADDGTLRPIEDAFIFQLPLSQTWRLLDLQDCVADLDSVITIGEILEKRIDGGDFDFNLFNALVIAYGRGFQTGRSREPSNPRANLRPYVDRLSKEQRQRHDAVIDIRNRRVAHSVDSGQAVVTVSFGRDGVFRGLGALHTGLPVGAADVRSAVALAKYFRDLADAESAELRSELEREWGGRSLTAEQLETAEQNLAMYLEAAASAAGAPVEGAG